MSPINKKIIIAVFSIAILVTLFSLTKDADPEYFRNLGFTLSLPLFTFLIATIDGFNPCTMWILTFLLVLLISVSGSRKRIFIVGFSFVVIVFSIYFLFTAVWLNIFRYIGFINPLRITIGIVALIAGLYNLKAYFFSKASTCPGGVCEVQEKSKEGFLKRIVSGKIGRVTEVIRKGSIPALIIASITLAAFSSLVELPCTAGWPIIYTGVLSSKLFAQSISYYGYLFLYNIFYVIPLSIIILLFGWFFKGKEISKNQMQIIKLGGGLIMILLGIILLFNPELLILVE